MDNDQERLLTGIEAMMNALPPSDWRLNMIPTDPTMVYYDQQFPLVPGDTIDDARTMYTFMTRGALEEGFDAVITYIDQNTYAQTWMRNTAALLIVFVSDEEEQSFSGVTDANVIATFELWLDAARSSQYVASIVHLPYDTSLCDGPYAESEVGDRYIQVTEDYEGVVVDICSENWAAGVEDASKSLMPVESWQLKYTPEEETIAVFVNEAVYPNSKWNYDAEKNSVQFIEIPGYGSHIDISYNIDKSTYPEEECPSEK